MNCCYILYSEKLQRHYVGACHDDLAIRIQKHNTHQYGEHRFTAKASDWELKVVINCATYSQAMKLEKHIKNMKSSVYIDNLIKYPEMVQKLLEKYPG
jgi:putative endonuclease